MMHDPFQTYATLGSYYGMPTPIGLPYQAQQGSAINPAALNPLTAILGQIPQVGQSPFGQYPGQGLINPQQLQQQLQQQQLQQQLQQLQLAQALASQAAIPQLLGLSQFAGGFQNPLLAALVNNPLLAAGLQHGGAIGQQPFGQQPFGQQAFGQQPFGLQQYSPYQQHGQISPFGGVGYPLAPQSWIGQGSPFGVGQGFGAIQPLLSQWSQRPFQSQGISPWGY
jgi:hypothetical protein